MEIMIVYVAVGVVALFLIWWASASANKQLARLRSELNQVQKENTQIQTALSEHLEITAKLQAENDALAQFKAILDAKAEAARIVLEATQKAEEAQHAANLLRQQADSAARQSLELAEQEARTLRAQANQTLKEAQNRVDSIIHSAQQEAESIVQNANKRGEDIAGKAFEAVRNAEHFEQVAKAMRNLIEGYGDQYVIPSRSLLDELAEDYGFTEAGEELKNARERSRAMVKNSTAANCDYVEPNRRETAIRFVVDAFNGKVDSILSRSKCDNVGKLEQEIRDAFNLVNFNGSAFRNARIHESFLEARLTELRWAATVQEIKLRDKEEQRRIKEQIREEERAQREFERSMREAAKEEEYLRKAMDKIQSQVDKASAEQKAKYEAQLAEMLERLREAEERNQRAISMAQQTKMGHVYIISNVGSFGEHVFKIGLTRRLEPIDRIRELGDASVPFNFDVHALIFSDNAPALETTLHRQFVTAQINKVNPRKEFFRVPITAIREQLEKLGIKPQWTLTAEAREYRESQAIERALKEDPVKGRQWLESQAIYEPSGESLTEEVGVAEQ
jgi:hypothetical protein